MPVGDIPTRLNTFAAALDALAEATRGIAEALANDSAPDKKQNATVVVSARSLPTLDDLRQVKEKNVSWQQLIRGGRADLGVEVPELRRSDKSLARRVAREANLTIAELVQVLQDAGIEIEEAH